MFFTDGCAVEDFNWPDRLILGSTSNEAVQMLKQIFHPLVMRGVPVIVTNQATAELVREAATAFVATKISFINEVAALVRTGERGRREPCSGSRPGQKNRSRAACSPERAWAAYSPSPTWIHWWNWRKSHGVPLKVLSAARDVNTYLADRLVDKISLVLNSVENKDVGILGLAFKPNTNSVAGSSSVRLAENLVSKGRARARL